MGQSDRIRKPGFLFAENLRLMAVVNPHHAELGEMHRLRWHGGTTPGVGVYGYSLAQIARGC